MTVQNPIPKKKTGRLNGLKRFYKSMVLSRQMKKEREGELICEMVGHDEGVNCLSVSYDGSLLVSGSDDATARLWNIEVSDDEDLDDEEEEEDANKETKAESRKPSAVSKKSRSPSAVSTKSNADGSLRPASAKSVKSTTSANGSRVGSAKSNADGGSRDGSAKSIADEGSRSGSARSTLSNIEDGGSRSVSAKSTKSARSNADDGSRSASAISSKSKAEPGSRKPSANHLSPDDVISRIKSASSKSGSRASSAASTKSLKTYPCVGMFKGHKSYIKTIQIFKNLYVFTGGADGLIKKWDLASCRSMFTYKGHTHMINKLLITDDVVMSTSKDKLVKIWYTKVKKATMHRPCIRTLKGHTYEVHPLVFIPHDVNDDAEPVNCVKEDGELIHPDDIVVSGSADHTAKIWSLYSGECLHTLRGHQKPVTTLAADPRGRTLFSGAGDNFIKFWDIKTGRMLRSIEAHGGPIICMNISHRLMYTGSADGLAKCWVTEFGDNTVTYKEHGLSVTVVKFYKGLLITGCGDGVVRCYDAKSGHLLRTFSGHEGAITAIQTAGERIFTSTTDNVIRVFKIDWEFVKSYLKVLSGDVEDQLGDDYVEEVEIEQSDHEEEVVEDVVETIVENEEEAEEEKGNEEEKSDEDEKKSDASSDNEDEDEDDEDESEEEKEDEDEEDNDDDDEDDDEEDDDEKDEKDDKK